MIDEIFHALAEPNRREILRLIRDQELPAGAISAHFHITRPAISQHLKILEAAGLVTMRKAGTQRLYRTRVEALQVLRQYLDTFWSDQLQALKQAAEAEQRRVDDGSNATK